MFKTKLILASILLLGFILRVYDVGELPRILNRDEAALAYNALLLKETGKDEWGRSWPLALESFGDYKLPGYPALLVILFSLLGYSDFATRLPSVIAGTALIGSAYWWARNLKWSQPLALVTAGIIAVTPVFWFYSRMAYEANVALTLVTIAIGWWWFIKDDGYQWLRDLAAGVVLLVAIFTYNTPLLLLPFIALSLPLRRGLVNVKAWIVPILIMGGVGIVSGSILIPLSAQKSGITIFSDESVWMESVTYRSQFTGVAQKILGSKYVYFLQIILKNLATSFSPTFLVTAGGTHPWHQLPGSGHIYWVTYGLGLGGLIIGLTTLILNAFTSLSFLFSLSKIKKVITQPHTNGEIWLLYLAIISLAPSVVTVDSPHATRSLLFFFAFSLLAVLALNALIQKVATISYLKAHTATVMKVGLAVVVLLLVWETETYAAKYFFEYPGRQTAFQPGFAEILKKTDLEHRGETVAIVDGGGYHYILTAWYKKMTPDQFFATIVKQLPDRIGFKYGERVGGYHFIAKVEDRLPQEKVVIVWNDLSGRWEIKTF